MLLGGGGENMELVEEEDNGHGVTGRYFAKKKPPFSNDSVQ